jgi:hypothetical protein
VSFIDPPWRSDPFQNIINISWTITFYGISVSTVKQPQVFSTGGLPLISFTDNVKVLRIFQTTKSRPNPPPFGFYGPEVTYTNFYIFVSALPQGQVGNATNAFSVATNKGRTVSGPINLPINCATYFTSGGATVKEMVTYFLTGHQPPTFPSRAIFIDSALTQTSGTMQVESNGGLISGP